MLEWRKSKTVVRVAIVVALLLSIVWHLWTALKDACWEYRYAIRREFSSGLRALKSGRVEDI